MTNYVVYQSKIRNDFRVCIMSDLHYNFYTNHEKLERIHDKLKEIKPDYILLPGDLLDFGSVFDDRHAREHLLGWLRDISAIAPIFISLGNHEYYQKVEGLDSFTHDFPHDYVDEVQKLTNVYLLNNESFEDDRVFITGYTASEDYYNMGNGAKKTLVNPLLESRDILISQLKSLKENIVSKDDKLAFILIHSPIYLKDDAVKNILDDYDYFVSGHMHNGCVPPGIYEIWRSSKGIISPDKSLFPNNARNTLKTKDDKLIVSGPITMFSKHTPFLRALNLIFPMYMTVIDFTCDEKYNTHKILKKCKYRK